MAEQLSKLSVIFLLDTSRFERALTDTQKKMRRVGREMSDLGQKMAIGLSLPIALAGKRITETATAFEYQMARVQAISGATSASFQSLQKNAEALGASTIFTAREVGALQEEFAKLGFTAEEIVQVTESTLSLAQVTGAALPRAAEIAGATLRTFGMEANQVAEVNDLVAVAISKSALDFESFAETMKYAGSQAAVSGVTMSELGAAMGVLANRGVKGSIAGTRLRMIFAKLTEEGGDTHQKFLDLIHGSMSMAEAIDRFGIRAATAIPVLQENAAEFDRLEQQMRLSAGTLEIMQETMDDTSFAAQKKLKSAMEDVSIQMGKALLPIINAVAEALTAIANGFASLDTGIQTTIVVIGVVIAAVGPLLLIIGQLNLALVTMSIVAPKAALAIKAMTGPVGVLIAVMSALLIGVMSTADATRKLEDNAVRVARAQDKAIEATTQATSQILMLITAYENENRTLEEKQDILNQLAQLDPSFENLKAEKTEVNKLKQAYEDLFATILKQETAKAFLAEFNKLTEERAQALIAQDRAQRELDDIAARAAAGEKGFAPEVVTRGQKYGGLAGTYEVDPMAGRKAALEGKIQFQQGLINELDSQGKEIQAIMEKNDMMQYFLGLGGKGKTPESETLGMREQRDIMADLAKELKVIEARSDALDLTIVEEDTEKLKAYTKAFEALIEAGVDGQDVATNLSFVKDEVTDLNKAIGNAGNLINVGDILLDLDQAMGKAIQTFGNLTGPEANLKSLQMQQDAVRKALEKLKEETPGATSEIARLAEQYERLTNAINQAQQDLENFNLKQQAVKIATDGMSEGFFALGSAMVAVGDATKSMARRMLESAAATLSAMVKQLYVQWAQSALSGPEPALAKIALLGVGAGALSGFLNNIPALAQGGIAIGPQLAMVGDNRSGREAIIPLEKLPGLMQKMGGGMGGRLYGTIDGYDIVLSNERNNRLLQRATR